MKTQSHWVCSTSLEPPTYKKGANPREREITHQEAKALGVGAYSMRLHLFTETRDTTKVFLSILLGTLQDLEPRLRGLTDRKSFRVVSYKMYHPILQPKYAKLFPPADLTRHFWVYALGLINAILMPVATKEIQPKIDPKQYITSIRYVTCHSHRMILI